MQYSSILFHLSRAPTSQAFSDLARGAEPKIVKFFLASLCLLLMTACSNHSGDSGSAGDNASAINPAVPTAAPDTANVPANTTTVIDVLDNDSANTADGMLTITDVTMPSSGTVINNGNDVSYTPNSGVSNSSDSFTYTVENSDGETATATVTVNIGNATPTAEPDSDSVEPNSSVNIDVLRNDSANTDDGTLTITNVSSPSQGTANENSGEITYTPNANVSGTTDSFTYTIQNSDGEMASATVDITINNAVPTATADSFTVPPNSMNNPLDVLDNDSANTAGTLMITMVTAASNGTVTINNDTELLYTPNNGVSDTTDTFTYTIENKDGETASATVTVNITNNAGAVPTAADDELTINQNSPRNAVDVLDNDDDPNDASGASLMIVDDGNTVRSANGGLVRIAADGRSLTYEPPVNFTGTDTFDYTLSNGSFTDTATVTVTVNGFNAAQMQFRPCEAEAADRKAAGRPYCFDVGIPVGFDGHTKWVTVFVPAQDILDAQQPPIILHGHGFGESRFASLENPNSFMRFRVTAQSLLELWHEGYWVVSFDQRGFNASGLWGNNAESSNSTSNETCTQDGDTMCIDVMSPEREARDPTVIIDWLTANLCDGFDPATVMDMASTTPPMATGCATTPLYAEDEAGDPVLGSIGLSYGGGWQSMGTANDKALKEQLGITRTDDTRVDAMVLVTTWYDLRSSLIQNGVPKSGWFQFLTAATQLGGAPLAADGFLLQAGNEVFVQDNVSQATLDGLYARSVRSYCENMGDNTFATDDTPTQNLTPELGSGSVPAGTNGPDVFLIQGQRDILFNFDQAYDMAQCYQQANPAADVRTLIQTEGHILATAQSPSYKDTQESGESQVIYIDETVYCDNTDQPLSSSEMIADWFRTKLGAVDSAVDAATQTINDIPTVCVTHYEPNAAPVSGRSYASLNDVVIGGNLTINLDGDANTNGDQAVTFMLPTNPPISGDDAGVAPPPPVFQQELMVATADTEIVGIPTIDLDITANGPPGLDPPRFFVGLALDRGNGLKLIADQVTPISGPVPQPTTDCFSPNACTVNYEYPRTDDKGILHGEGVGRLFGFGVKLRPNDRLVLVIHDQIPVYNAHGTNPGGYNISLTGSVTLPVVP